MENEKAPQKKNKPIIGITLGDINGIGPEVVIKSINDNRLIKYITPVIYASTKVLSFYRKSLDINDLNYSQVKNDFFHHKKINVYNCWEEVVEINPGKVDPQTGIYAFKALEKATEHLMEGKIDALVTGPINKKIIQNKDFQFPGQTEYLTSKTGKKDSLMMLVGENLKVGLVTTHMPVSKVAEHIDKEGVAKKIELFLSSLKKDFGITKPKLAVLALNPHAGDDGLIGQEEIEILTPVIEDYKNKGHLVYGPFPSDGFFGARHYKNYDGILAMYHDQGLIAFKTLSFEEGVNYTAGLDFIRTSPDHGTAYNIAGRNEASEISMRTAIFLAKAIHNNRNPVQEED